MGDVKEQVRLIMELMPEWPTNENDTPSRSYWLNVRIDADGEVLVCRVPKHEVIADEDRGADHYSLGFVDATKHQEIVGAGEVPWWFTPYTKDEERGSIITGMPIDRMTYEVFKNVILEERDEETT